MEYTTRDVSHFLKNIIYINKFDSFRLDLKNLKVYEHLSQPWFTDGGQDRAVARRLGIATSQMQDEWRWIQSLYEDDSDLEISFWLDYYVIVCY